MPPYESITEIWIKEGEARGRAQGEVLGEARALRQALLRVLESRFNEVPDAVREIVDQTDQAALDRLFDRALTAASLDEILED